MEGLGFFHICKLDVLFHRSKVNTLQFFVSFSKLIIRICVNLYEISPTFVSFRRHRSGCTVAQPEKIKPDSRSKDVWPGRPPRGGHDAVLRAPHGARAHRPAGAAARLLHRRADVRPAARARGHERPETWFATMPTTFSTASSTPISAAGMPCAARDVLLSLPKLASSFRGCEKKSVPEICKICKGSEHHKNLRLTQG